MSCDICAHADRHGSWVDAIPGLTHCRRCHGCWPMASELQHCATCCRTFTNWRAADAHRRSGECRDPRTVRDRHGRHRLVESTRRWRPGTTVTVWTLDRHQKGPHSFPVACRSAAEGTG